MTNSRRFVMGVVAVLVLATGTLAISRVFDGDPPPPVPVDPMAHDVELVLAVPFTVELPYSHTWRSEQPAFDAGWVLVLASDPALLHPRQGPMPILYVGDQTAERINFGHESGHLVVLVPAARDSAGRPAFDLGAAPVFFGEPGLPEEVDAASIAAELARATSRGQQPPSAASIAGALRQPVAFVDDGDLRTWAADLVEQYSPQEVDLVSGLRAPRLRR